MAIRKGRMTDLQLNKCNTVVCLRSKARDMRLYTAAQRQLNTGCAK